MNAYQFMFNFMFSQNDAFNVLLIRSLLVTLKAIKYHKEHHLSRLGT